MRSCNTFDDKGHELTHVADADLDVRPLNFSCRRELSLPVPNFISVVASLSLSLSLCLSLSQPDLLGCFSIVSPPGQVGVKQI